MSFVFNRDSCRRLLCTYAASLIVCLASASVVFAQPIPTVTATPPAAPLIGEAFSFPVTFDNTGSAVGYGPYVDLILPATGIDGTGIATDDGVTFVSATYLGQPVTATPLTFDASGNATHPYARSASGVPLIVTGTPGDQLVVLQLPFGSFTPSQPATDILVNVNVSNLADLGTSLVITARGGFRYGADALDNPPSDPSIVGAYTPDQTIVPSLWSLRKTYIGPEDETATGPNFPRQYRIDVDVATGQTVTSLDITDVLPANLQFLAVVSTLVNGAPSSTTSVETPSLTTPGGTLTRRFASVTGTAGNQDASLIFSFYVPRANASSTAVINPGTGDDATAVNDAQSQGSWTPIDSRDPVTVASNNVTANDHTLTPKSIAIQKGFTIATDTGAAGPTPGDVIEYTLSVQISDFFVMQGLVLSDVLSDGQRPDGTFVPTLAIGQHSGGGSSAAAMNVANFDFVVDSMTGETDGTFRVGVEQMTRGLSDRLLGGCVPAGGTVTPDCSVFNGGATTITVVYRAVIQEDFTHTFPSGDPSVDHGDTLSNAVTALGNLLSTTDATTPTGSNEADTSAESLVIASGTLLKTIYAINGDTSFGTPQLGPGDTVTYRLRYTLPSSDLENLSITDFLPLPVLFASEIGGAFDSTVSAAAPPAGTAKFGPDDTFFGLSASTPSITVDAAANSVAFGYPAFDDPSNTPTTIDILFTVTASDEPFADGLFLTNQARVTEGTTNAGEAIVDAIVQIQLNEPQLRVQKGVVTSDNAAADVYTPATVGPVTFSAPGSAGFRGSGAITSNGLTATPINSNAAGLDAGDIVTFAIVVENVGSGPDGAFDVRVRDTLPTGFSVPSGGLNLSVTDGNGNPLTFSDIGAGLFDQGIELTDPGVSQGALTVASPTSGTNIAVVTYDLQIDATVTASTAITNTATLTNYAGTEGGPDFTAVDLSDPAIVTTAAPSASKIMTATNQAHTLTTSVAIGERVSYRVTLRVPEGVTPAAALADTLDPGLALLSLDGISASPSVTAANGSFATILGAATVGPVGGVAGRLVTITFGDLTNADTDDSTNETITIDYTVVVLNSSGNNRGVGRNNAVSLTFTGGTATASAPNVTIVEPTLQVAKSALPTSGDAGDAITFTVTLSHTGASNTTAFDVSLADVLPPQFTFVGATFQSGTAAPTSFLASGGFSASWTSFPVGSTATFQLTATINGGLGTGTVLTNTATTTYTSLPGSVTTAQSPYNTLSTERTGNAADPGGAENDYTAQGSAAVTVSAASVNKILTSTNQTHTSGTSVAIGEVLTYAVTVTVPEAISTGVTLVDTLDAGLAFVGFDSLQVSDPGAVTTDVPGGFPAVLTNATVSNPGGADPVTAGSRVSLSFGTVTNSDANGAVPETITLTYRAVMLNASANVTGQARNNSVAWTAGGSPVSTSAPNVTIVEPGLQVDKTVLPTTADAGDTVTFTMVVSHTGASNATAFNVALSDSLPAGLTVTSGPTAASGVVPTSLGHSSGVITATWDTFAVGSSTTITFGATVGSAVTPGQIVTNTAAIVWTSLPGVVGTPQSSHNTLSVERTGDTGAPGGAANTYAASDPASVTTNTNTLSGRVYVDANGNGVFTPGEPAIAGVAVTLTGTDHLGSAVSVSVVTMADGTYTFTGLPPGTYAVHEQQPNGWADGADAAGSLGGTIGNDVVTAVAIPVGAMTTATNYDFGERPTADLEVVKTDSQDPVLAGDALTYTIVVHNFGPSAADNVVLRDPLPAGVSFISINAPGLSCTSPSPGSSGDIECTAASLAAGASATMTVTLQVATGLIDGAVLMNGAAVRSTTVDLVPSNNTDSEPTVVAASTSADVAVSKTDASDPVAIGANVVYTLTVRNNGPANATNVVVSDTLPAGVALVSAVPSQGAPCTGATTVSCALGALANGAQATVTIEVTPSAPGVITNAAAVTATEIDPAPGNNVASEPTTIGAPTDADLRITKIDAVDPVTPDAVVPYRIVVENRGPAPAASVVFQDTTPAGTTFDSLAAPGGWSCTTPAIGTAGIVSCGAATLASGATATFNLYLRVGAAVPAGTIISNVALVAASTPDPDASNNSATETTTIANESMADLLIVKTDSPDAQAAGAPVSYTLLVTNRGPATATNVTVTDPLPAGSTFMTASGACSAAGGVLTCAIGSLAPGSSTAIAVTVDSPSVPGLMNNTATVAAAEADPVTANNSEPETTTLVGRADVRIAKAGPASATAGNQIVYTLTVINDGPSQADTVTVADPTPAGLTFASTTGACTSAFPCLLGTMQPGESRVITATFIVPSGYAGPNPIVNTATVSTVTAGDDPSNNTAPFSSSLSVAADIAVAKTSSTLSPGVGTTFDYIITATNLGPSDASNVTVTEFLPAGATYVSHATSSGTYVPATAQWAIPTLTAGATTTLTLTMRADVAGPLANTARRTASDQPDGNPTNDEATVTPVAVNEADVAIVKTGPASVLSGTTVSYTLTIQNNGPALAVDVVVADPTATNMTFVSNGGDCATAFPCALGDLAPGAVRTISATYTVGLVPNGTVVANTASVTSSTPDTVAANNSSTVNTAVDTRVDVGVAKTVVPAQVSIGDTATYTVTATNHGPNPATNIVVSDQVPAGLTLLTALPSTGTYDEATGRWSVGTLAVGQSATLLVEARVEVAGAIANVAVRTSQTEPDADSSNDSAAAVINGGLHADIGVFKDANPIQPTVGANVSFTIRAVNRGPDTAPSVAIDDALPAGVTFVSALASRGSFDAATGRWTIGSMANGTVETLTIVSTVTQPGAIVNTARVSNVGVSDPNPVNDRSTVVLNGATTDVSLRLSKTALRPLVGVFEDTVFLVTITNDGPGTATGVEVTDALPPGLTFRSAQASQGSYSPGSGVWSVGTLAQTESATLQIVAQVGVAGSVVNVAEVSASNELDLTAGDDAGSAAVATPATTGGSCADVELRQEYQGSVVPSGTLRYVMTAVNHGPAYAQDVAIVAMIPDGTTVDSMSPSAGGSCMVMGNMATCTWPGATLMGEGGARTAEFVVRLGPGIPAGSVVWGWFMFKPMPNDCNGANDSVDSYVMVNDGTAPTADLLLRGAIVTPDAMESSVAAAVEQPVTIRVAVTNNGSVSASGEYQLNVSRAGSLAAHEVSVSHGTMTLFDERSARWSTGMIEAGTTALMDLVVSMTDATSTKLTVTKVSGVPVDPDTTNDIIELAIDGVGPVPASGRWVAIGNIDGALGGEIVTGAGEGERPQVRVFSGRGIDSGIRFNAFEPAFLGGVRLASCDVDNDGVDEIVAAQGRGGSAVRVFHVVAGNVTELTGFHPFETDFRGGVYVACSDVNSDGRDDIVVGAGAGRAPEVSVFSASSMGAIRIATWTAYERAFTGGVRVASAAYPGGPFVNAFHVVTVPGPGRPVEARAWMVAGGAALPVTQGLLLPSTYIGGATVDLGDVDGDGALDLLVMPDGGTPWLLSVLSLDTARWVLQGPSGAAGFTGELRVDVGILGEGPGAPELVAAQGPGGPPVVQVFRIAPNGIWHHVTWRALELP